MIGNYFRDAKLIFFFDYQAKRTDKYFFYLKSENFFLNNINNYFSNAKKLSLNA